MTIGAGVMANLDKNGWLSYKELKRQRKEEEK
jgi:hypothetical protein